MAHSGLAATAQMKAQGLVHAVLPGAASTGLAAVVVEQRALDELAGLVAQARPQESGEVMVDIVWIAVN